MRAADTNVLIRLITGDDPKQAAAAESFIEPGAWVAQVVLAETVWVLQSVYGLGRAEIARVVEMLLAHERLVLDAPETVASALEQFRKKPRTDFSDCLVLEAARKAGHPPVGTFDRAFARLEGVQRL